MFEPFNAPISEDFCGSLILVKNTGVVTGYIHLLVLVSSVIFLR